MISIYSIVEIIEFSSKSKRLRENFFNEQNKIVSGETNKIIEFVNLSRLFLEDKLNRMLYERTNEAWALIDNIYKNNKGKKSQPEIKEIIKDALRPIRFNNQRGYYFMLSFNGIDELYPTNPEVEGKNLLNLRDDMGNYVIKNELDIIEKFGEGFVTDFWKKPNDLSDKVYPKTSFIKGYKPLGLYVGCGEYLDEVLKDIQADAIKSIKLMRFNSNGYAFVYNFNGIPIVSNDNESNRNISDTVDINGVKVFKKMRSIVDNLEGGFLTYHWAKPGTDSIVPKLAFCRAIHDWEWIVGSCVYLDQIETLIAKEKHELFNQLSLNILIVLSFSFFLYMFVLAIIKRVTNNLKLNLNNFSQNLEHSITNFTEIPKSDNQIEELIDVTNNINSVISKRKAVEVQLLENESLYRKVFDHVPVLLIILDSNYNTTRWNIEAEKYFFAIPNEFHGFTAPIIHKQASLESLKKMVLHEQEFKEGIANTLQIETKEGIRHQTWTILKTQANNFILVGFDITDIKNQEVALKESNNAKDTVFSIISHDLYDPFTSIISITQTLLAKFDELSEEKKRNYLTQINTSSSAMNNQFQKLIQWSKLQSGSISVSFEKVILHSIVENVLIKLILQAHTKFIEIKNNIEYSVRINADSILLEIVLHNIISNSIKFTNKRGVIELSAVSLTQFTTIIINDNGIGMGKSQLENIFDLVKTPRRKGTGNETGVGLGLIISKEYVEKMGGRIWVESVEDGGTTTYIQLQTF